MTGVDELVVVVAAAAAVVLVLVLGGMSLKSIIISPGCCSGDRAYWLEDIPMVLFLDLFGLILSTLTTESRLLKRVNGMWLPRCQARCTIHFQLFTPYLCCMQLPLVRDHSAGSLEVVAVSYSLFLKS